MPDKDLSNALEYSNHVLERAVDWYKNADAKAQIILTLNGVFLTFLTTAIFRDPVELLAVTQKFNIFTWIFLTLMCLCLIGSLGSAIMALWSRISFSATRDEAIIKEIEKVKGAERYSPNVMYFFQTISWLDRDKFQEELIYVDEEFAVRALGNQIYNLSKRVVAKHIFVNIGFLLSGVELVFFLASGISYLAGFA